MIGSMLAGATQAITLFVFAIGLALPFGYLGPQIESTLFPVVKDFKARVITTDDTTTTYELSFDKVRLCEPRPDLFSWYIIQDGVNVRAPITFSNGLQTPPDQTARPTGKAKEIYWVVTNRDKGPFDFQTVMLYHDCHTLWTSKTIINIP